MITTILVFIATSIAIVIYTIYSFRWFALFIFLLLAFIIYIKVRREIKKYGPKSIFRAFHQYPIENEQLKLVKNLLLSKIKVQSLFEMNSEILVGITHSGIYIIKVLDSVGKISGDKKDSSFILKGEKVEYVSNFFLELDTIEKDIKKQIKNVIIKKIIVKKGTCLIEVPYSKAYFVVGMHNFYYELQKLAKEKLYTEEKIKELDLSLTHILSNNVKLK